MSIQIAENSISSSASEQSNLIDNPIPNSDDNDEKKKEENSKLNPNNLTVPLANHSNENKTAREASITPPHQFINHHDQSSLQNISSLNSSELYEYLKSILLNHVNLTNHLNPSQMKSLQLIIEHLKDVLLNNNPLPPLLHPTGGSTINTMYSDIESDNDLENEAQDHIEPLKRFNPDDKKDKQWCTHSFRESYGITFPSSTLLHHPDYRINPKKHFGLFRGSVRQDWNTIETDDDEERNWEELKPHWFELFFDLMFVASIVHISSEVATAYDNHSYWFIYTVFPMFGLLVLSWLEQVLYQSRFRMTQKLDDILRFIYMGLVLTMGLSIGDTQIFYKFFVFAYMLTKLCMLCMFAKSLLIRRSENHSIYMMCENIFSIIICIFIEIFVNINHENDDYAWIWIIIFGFLFVYSYFHVTVIIYCSCIRTLGINIPINVPHIAERMGAFVLIILGETVISIMVQHIVSTKEGMIIGYLVTLSFFVIVYCIGLLYFGSQPTEYELHHHKRSHAMSSSVWRARIYKWFHILLFFGLLGLGLGSKLTTHNLLNYHSSDPVMVFMPGISCVIICICINVIRLTHPFDYTKKHPFLVKFIWILRILCIAIMFGILFTWKVMNHFIILAIYVCAFIVQIFIDFEANHRLVETKSLHKEKTHNRYQYQMTNKNDTTHHTHSISDLSKYSKFNLSDSFIGAF